MTASDILLDLKGFIEQHEHPYKRWYVGLALDAEDKLFNSHKVNRQLDSWIYRSADSSEIARAAYDSCLKWDCDRGKYDNKFKGTFVYAYLKSQNTSP